MDDLKHLARQFVTVLGAWDSRKYAAGNNPVAFQPGDSLRAGSANDLERARDIANRILDGRAVK